MQTNDGPKTESSLVIRRGLGQISNTMQFEYEITADDYVAAQMLCHKLTYPHKRIPPGVVWILSGFFLLVVVWNEKVQVFSHALLLLIGVWWIYGGVITFFPGRHYRKFYAATGLAGEKFMVDATEEGLSVKGNAESWQLKWAAVRSKGEDDHIFVLCAGTIFMFGKQYLSRDQQEELKIEWPPKLLGYKRRESQSQRSRVCSRTITASWACCTRRDQSNGPQLQ